MASLLKLYFPVFWALLCALCQFQGGCTLDPLSLNGTDPQVDNDDEIRQIVLDFLQSTGNNHDHDNNNNNNIRASPHQHVHTESSHSTSSQSHTTEETNSDSGRLLSRFPCYRMGPSKHKPRSVHRLRPADVDVVAAIGDSLTAGKAAGSKGMAAVLFDYRGLSWSIGGDGTFETLHSLPNILREYNPDLYGFSNSIGDLMSETARLNVAKSGATSDNLAFQASLLIQRMRNDPHVDFENDWKVITILIGANDLCRSCKAEFTPERYIDRLRSALDILHDAVPRAFVNLVEVMPVELARFLPRDAFCKRIETYYCGCAVEPQTESHYDLLIHDRKEFQRLTEELVASGVYDDKDDFTVVLQPFYKNFSLQMVPGTDDIDYSIFAVDCFHLSMQGQSRGGLGLWNNMLQPIGHKSTSWAITEGMLCPTQAHPFLATARNSKTPYRKFWRLVNHKWIGKTSSSSIQTIKQRGRGHFKSYAKFSLGVIERIQNVESRADDHKTVLGKEDAKFADVTASNSSYEETSSSPGPGTNTSLPDTALVRRGGWWDEPEPWEIWSIVMGWTLLMSTILVYCVSILKARAKAEEEAKSPNPLPPKAAIEIIEKKHDKY